MSHFNMTDESDFEGNEAFFEENRPKSLSFWDIFLTLLFAFFAIGFFYQSNQVERLEFEIAEQDTLINHLGTVIDDDLKMHHQKHSK